MAIITQRTQRSLKSIAKTVRGMFNEIRDDLSKKITRIIEEEIETAIVNSGEVEDIVNGIMRGELGLTQAQAKIRAIINHLKKDIRQKVAIAANRDKLTIQAVNLSFQTLLRIPEARQTRTGIAGNVTGRPLPWLKWMLVEGGNIIITDHYSTRRVNVRGRSGQRIIMRPSGQRASLNWSVPLQFQGVTGDNFLTRAFDNRASNLQRRISAQVRKSINDAALRVGLRRQV